MFWDLPESGYFFNTIPTGSGIGLILKCLLCSSPSYSVWMVGRSTCPMNFAMAFITWFNAFFVNWYNHGFTQVLRTDFPLLGKLQKLFDSSAETLPPLLKKDDVSSSSLEASWFLRKFVSFLAVNRFLRADESKIFTVELGQLKYSQKFLS